MTKTEYELLVRLVEYIETTIWGIEHDCKQLKVDIRKLGELLTNVQPTN